MIHRLHTFKRSAHLIFSTVQLHANGRRRYHEDCVKFHCICLPDIQFWLLFARGLPVAVDHFAYHFWFHTTIDGEVCYLRSCNQYGVCLLCRPFPLKTTVTTVVHLTDDSWHNTTIVVVGVCALGTALSACVLARCSFANNMRVITSSDDVGRVFMFDFD